MGIPLYREAPSRPVSPQTKLPVVCPSAGARHAQSSTPGRNATRSHVHHRSRDHQDTLDTGSATMAMIAPSSMDRRAQHLRLPPSSDTGLGAGAESHERSDLTTSRYTQRIVRSPPGTREHEDEVRAAELVDLYFRELAHVRSASHAQQRLAQHTEDTTPASTDLRPRGFSQRALELIARRQRRDPDDQRHIHEPMLRREQQRAIQLHGVTRGDRLPPDWYASGNQEMPDAEPEEEESDYVEL